LTPMPRLLMNCELCGRDVPGVTLHHLVPRATHTKRLKEELGEERNRKASLCVACHRQLHAMFENKVLGRELSTLEAIRRDEDVVKYVAWIRKRPGTFIPKKGRKRR